MFIILFTYPLYASRAGITFRGEQDGVLEALDEEGIDYAVFEEVGRGDFEAMVQFPVPPIGVEPILERLTGVREDAYTIVIAPETVVSQRLSALMSYAVQTDTQLYDGLL